MRFALIFLVAFTTVGLEAQSSTAASTPLAPLDFLIGRWQGTSEGQPGSGSVEREYSRVLNARFVHLRNRVVYPPQPTNLKGEAHEDIGLFSFDQSRKQIVLRQFHVEGFVNQYAQQLGDAAPDRIVFVSEAIENIPNGYRARETYIRISANEVEEVFELASPGKDFEVYSRARLKRVTP